MKHLLVAATMTASVWLATPTWADPVFFRTGNLETRTARFENVTFSEVTRLVNNRGVFDKRGLVPQVRITSPLDGAVIAPGDSLIGAGDPNGTGFAIVAEIVTRDDDNVTVDEDVNIRNVRIFFGLIRSSGPVRFIRKLARPTDDHSRQNQSGPPLQHRGGRTTTMAVWTIWAGWHCSSRSARARATASTSPSQSSTMAADRVDRVSLNVAPSVRTIWTSGNGLTQTPASRTGSPAAPHRSCRSSPGASRAREHREAPQKGSLNKYRSHRHREGDSR